MPRTTKLQDQIQNELRAASASSLDPALIAPRLMQSLERAIGWDGYRLFGVDSHTLLINRLLSASDNDGWARREWLQKVYLANDAMPYVELPTILRSGLRGVAYQDRKEQSWGFPKAMLSDVSPADHWRYFHESESPSGGVLLAGFPHANRWIAALQAYRRDAGKPFRPADVEFLKRSGSLVGKALGQALAREQALVGGTLVAPGAPGIVLVAPSREVTLATPAGEAWLELMWAGDGGDRQLLPTALWSAMMAIHRGDPLAAGTTVKVMTKVGSVSVEASAGDLQGSVALVITPHRSPPPPSVPDHWPLTDQQGQIVLLIAEGLSNRQIADSLFIGEHTVEWHIRQIFGRLGVRSRSQLIARYFREAVLGGYQDTALDSRGE